ncbi:hypothetical protein K1719_004081 [Acacia pycnantha]|nr:hypothetical protein K1719_004081 [Acacia pycnantha]
MVPEGEVKVRGLEGREVVRFGEEEGGEGVRGGVSEGVFKVKLHGREERLSEAEAEAEAERRRHGAKKGVLVSTLARQPLAVGRHEHGVALCYLLMLHSQRSIDYVEADDHQCHEDLPC